MMVQIGQMVQQCLTGRRRASGAGAQTDALVLAGLIPGPAATTEVEAYDGTSFSTRPKFRYF
jgi:hypothetical protein